MSPRRRTGAHSDVKPPRVQRAPRYRRGESVLEQSHVKRSLSDWRIALRIARRSVLGTVGTSAVVVAMVALPVAGFSAAALVGESTFPSPDERIAAELGQTEAKLYANHVPDPTLVQNPYDPWSVTFDTDETGRPLNEDPDAVPVDPRGLFPASTEILELNETGVTAETAGGKGQLAAVIGPVWDDAFAGRFEITAGEAPVKATEILVSAGALERLNGTVGSDVVLLGPEARTVTIAGVVDDAMFPDDHESLYFSSTAWPDLAASETYVTTWYLPNTAIDRSELSRLNTQGVTALSRAVLEDATAIDLATSGSFWLQYGVLLFLAGAFAVFEIVLLAGAAFAVGARKQQRSLATVASVGGSHRILYRIVTAQGLVLGLIGGLIGVGIGIPAGAIFMASTDDGSATQYWGFHLNPLAMTMIVVLAATVGLLSAIAPARAATRFDVLAALRGSRKPAAPNRRAPTIGLVLMIAGAVLTLSGAVVLRIVTGGHAWEQNVPYWFGLAALVAGPVLAQVGIIKCGALVLRTIARLVPRRLGLGTRLGARDSAANPSRAVPAFAAIMVTAFLGVIVINVAATSNRANEVNYSHQIAPGQMQVWIPHDEAGEQSADPRDLTDTLSSAVDVDRSAVISTGHMKWGPDGEVTADSTPWPSIPAENVCPWTPGSADHDAEIFDPASPGYSAAMQELRTDWRCAEDNYYLYGIGNSPIVVVSDAQELALLLGKKPSRAAVETLTSGGAVALWPDYVADHRLTISWWSKESMDLHDGAQIAIESSDALATVSLPAVVEKPIVRLNFGVVLSAETAKKLAIDAAPAFVLASLTTPPSQTQLDAATASLEALTTWPYYEKGPEDGSRIWILGALGLCGILFLGASTVAIGLARADGRQDDATLTAVGATRMLRRNFAFAQAAIIVGVGAVTGTLAGLLTTYAIALMDTTGRWAFFPPWPALGALVVGMPLAIAAGSWLVASRPTTLSQRMSVG
jgi:putative ABC transport system permease protein